MNNSQRLILFMILLTGIGATFLSLERPILALAMFGIAMVGFVVAAIMVVSKNTHNDGK